MIDFYENKEYSSHHYYSRFPPSDELQNQKELLSNASIVATIGSRMTTCFSYYHSFGLTEKYLIMIEQPWVSFKHTIHKQ